MCSCSALHTAKPRAHIPHSIALNGSRASSVDAGSQLRLWWVCWHEFDSSGFQTELVFEHYFSISAHARAAVLHPLDAATFPVSQLIACLCIPSHASGCRDSPAARCISMCTGRCHAPGW